MVVTIVVDSVLNTPSRMRVVIALFCCHCVNNIVILSKKDIIVCNWNYEGSNWNYEGIMNNNGSAVQGTLALDAVLRALHCSFSNPAAMSFDCFYMLLSCLAVPTSTHLDVI